MAFLMENLKINQESIRIFEENIVSKYGDILGTRRLKTLIVAEVCCCFVTARRKACCDFEGPNPVG